MALETASEQLFGDIVIEWGMSDARQVDRARQVQKDLLAQGKEQRIGELLMELGTLTKPQALKVLKEVNKRQGKKPRIGGYEIQEKIGQGGMGVVYRAKQVSMDRDIALKLLPRHLAEDEGFVQRFLSEARTSAKLNHRNIVTAIDVGEAGGYYYFAMEFVDGQPFDDVLAECCTIPENELIPLAMQVVGGLEHAAANGITHRDIKPANLMLCKDGVVKIADMGLAVAGAVASEANAEEDDEEAQAPNRAGTPYYMAPEQVEGVGPFDYRTDFYAFGATLYEMATGQKPFDGSSAQAIMAKRLYEDPPIAREANSKVSKNLSAVIYKLMQREADDRYDDFPSLQSDLDAVMRKHRPAALKEFAQAGKGTGLTMPRVRRSKKPRSVLRTILTWALSFGFLALCGGFTFAVLSRDKIKGPKHPDVLKRDVDWQAATPAPTAGDVAYALWVKARDLHLALLRDKNSDSADRQRVVDAYQSVISSYETTVYARKAQAEIQRLAQP